MADLCSVNFHLMCRVGSQAAVNKVGAAMAHGYDTWKDHGRNSKVQMMHAELLRLAFDFLVTLDFHDLL